MKTKEKIKLFLELNHVREDTPLTGKSCISLIEKWNEEYASERTAKMQKLIDKQDELIKLIESKIQWWSMSDDYNRLRNELKSLREKDEEPELRDEKKPIFEKEFVEWAIIDVCKFYRNNNFIVVENKKEFITIYDLHNYWLTEINIK